MYTFLVIIHVLNCLVMIGVVLLQSGKGADMGAAFGGSSQTVFGSRGAATFLSKVTVGAAALFFLTSLGLSILTRERLGSSSVIAPPAEDQADATPTPAATPVASTTPASGVITPETTPAAAPATASDVASTPVDGVTPAATAPPETKPSM